ncbi:MAG: vWA domain-containing protein [Nanoarchaeota archaeon]
MIIRDSELDLKDNQRIVKQASEIDELKGKLSSQVEEDKLMHAVLEADKDVIDDGKLISDSISQGLGSFTPDLLFESIVKDFKNAKKLYGESILRELSGYDPEYIEKNIPIPEFRRELKKKIIKSTEQLKEKGLIDKEGNITDLGLKLSSLVLYIEELDRMVLKGIGEKSEHRKAEDGDKKEYEQFAGQRFRDIAVRQSVKTAIRRSHQEMGVDDLRVLSHEKKGKITIIYAMDSSGSMKGEKLKIAKKAGIALAFTAISEKNNVGMIVFDSEIKKVIYPCQDFMQILESLAVIRAGRETNIRKVIEKSLEVFPRTNESKHLILLTDALPTKGQDPAEETVRAVSIARDRKITISVIGINLDEKGLRLAKRIVEVSNGRLYIAKDLENIDKIILEDYYAAKTEHM